MKYLSIVLFVFATAFFTPDALAQTPKTEKGGAIKLKAKPSVLATIDYRVKDGIFESGDAVRFNINVKTTLSGDQEGRMGYTVYSEVGDEQSSGSVNMKIKRDDEDNYDIVLKEKKAGFYKVIFKFGLTDYKDTLTRVFGIDPQKIRIKEHRPADFNDFWLKSKFMLSQIEPDYQITEQKQYSSKTRRVYLVEMRSWDRVTIRGWLTIPIFERPRKIPIKLRFPGYLSDLRPTLDDPDFAVFNLNVRGSGNSKDAISYTGEFNLYHIYSAESYVYRGVYMDCIRGADFIFEKADSLGLDKRRVCADGNVQGGTLAIVTAALDNRVSMLTTQFPMYSNLRTALKISPYLYPENRSPIFMLDKYLKDHPALTPDNLFDVWDYYDPMNFAAMVKCPVLMAINMTDELTPPRCCYGLFNKLGSKKKEIWTYPYAGAEIDTQYYKYQDFLVKETFVMP